MSESMRTWRRGEGFSPKKEGQGLPAIGSRWVHVRTQRIATVMGGGTMVAYRYTKPVPGRGAGKMVGRVNTVWVSLSTWVKNFAQAPGRGEPTKAVVLCTLCREPVEHARECYAKPTCYACLPPPEPLSVLPVPHITTDVGDCVSWCPACGPQCEHGNNSLECTLCRPSMSCSGRVKPRVGGCLLVGLVTLAEPQGPLCWNLDTGETHYEPIDWHPCESGSVECSPLRVRYRGNPVHGDCDADAVTP